MACRPASDQVYLPTACTEVTQKTAFATIVFQPRDDTVTYSMQYRTGKSDVFETPQRTVDIFDPSTEPDCGFISPCPGDTQCIVGELLEDLEVGTGYFLVGLCWEGGNPSPIAGIQTTAFTTFPAQTCRTGTALGASDTQAVITGFVTVGAQESAGVWQFLTRPDENRVRYYFEWGTTTAYGSTSQTFGPILATSDTEERQVYHQVSDLKPGNTYHFRIVAFTDEITVLGEDQTFDTDTVPQPIGVM